MFDWGLDARKVSIAAVAHTYLGRHDLAWLEVMRIDVPEVASESPVFLLCVMKLYHHIRAILLKHSTCVSLCGVGLAVYLVTPSHDSVLYVPST